MMENGRAWIGMDAKRTCDELIVEVREKDVRKCYIYIPFKLQLLYRQIYEMARHKGRVGYNGRC